MNGSVTTLIIILVVVLVSMSLHEMMHAYVSYWLGDDTAYLQGRVSLNPIRHIDPFLTIALPLIIYELGGPPIGAAKPVQVNFGKIRHGEYGAAIVGMIGPLTNLVLAVGAALIFRHLSFTSENEVKIVAYAVEVNAAFFIFNSIPWPPLDGSRLLYAFAPRPLQEFMERIEALGINGLLIYMFFVLTILQAPLSNIIIKFTNLLLGATIF